MKLHLITFILILHINTIATADSYTVRSVNLRQTPRFRYGILETLDANTSLRVLPGHPLTAQLSVETRSGKTGFVKDKYISSHWIEIYKKERVLVLIKNNGKTKKTYKVAFAPNRRLVDKIRSGDLATPEGRFYLAELDPKPKAPRYGARSMRLSYPNSEDARRGLAQGLINRKTYHQIVKAIRAGKIPHQRTKLGSSIRIHGGGSDSDWTAGCIALDDKDVIELYRYISKGTRVDIYRSKAQRDVLNQKGYLSKKILEGAKAQLKHPANYTNHALRLIPMKFPGGDIKKSEAVCTDIIIRALRHAGIDLQALIYEDALTHPKRYRRTIKKRNPNIDHRRARNHFIYFSHHARVLPNDKDYQPGDIVLMDTISGNGTPHDHIGIVSDQKNAQGNYLVINIWTVGYQTNLMNLLKQDYPKITGHFRLIHPFDF